jgi:hypothetical protein
MHRWEEYIKMDLEGVDWIHLTEQGPKGSIKYWEFLDQLSDC